MDVAAISDCTLQKGGALQPPSSFSLPEHLTAGGQRTKETTS